MSISKTKHYLVLNYNSSGVAISTRHDSFIVEGGSADAPGSLPLTFDEIAEVNSKSPAFKIGLLRFAPEVEEALYDALSIPNWRDIWTQEQIENMLRNPTMEMSQKILDIENDLYFERIRGVMLGLRSAGVDIPGKMERMIEQRRLELARRQRKTKIQLVTTEKPEDAQSDKQEMDAMRAELESMKAMMAELLKAQSATKVAGAEKDQPSVSSAKKRTGSKTK